MSANGDNTAHGEHGEHGSPFIQHHFDDAQHQFESGKLGMWVFLAQEVLFFSALFVAYIVYRYTHPEIFAYAHHYLDTTLGAVNTAVLIVSSLTAAWAVRAAQLNQRKVLIGCLAATILCAFGFLGIKYVEYSHKGHVGTLFGCYFNPAESPTGEKIAYEIPADVQASCAAKGITVKPHEGAGAERAPAAEGAEPVKGTEVAALPPPNTGMFFTVYFAMTGLHGIHVLAGIFVFIWLLWRAVKGHFTPEYYGPVDFAALYWHLVDLIWIFLFPLLYLIH